MVGAASSHVLGSLKEPPTEKISGAPIIVVTPLIILIGLILLLPSNLRRIFSLILQDH